MPLDTPNLDDRRFQDLVDEARRLIPRSSPRWTDHNLSDPGITLLELFATLVDTMIYRLNQVPDKSYVTFMELMGVRLQPPTTARAQITFWLSGELFGRNADSRLIPAETQVAVEQRGVTQNEITFTTDADLLLRPPRPLALLTSPAGGATFEDRSRALLPGAEDPAAERRDQAPLFGEKPQQRVGDSDGDSFYIIVESDLSDHVVKLTFTGPVSGSGIDPLDAPLRWEAWCGGLGWQPAALETDEERRDGTGGLNRPGSLFLQLPGGMARASYTDSRGHAHAGYAIRCQYVKRHAEQRGYSAPPRIETLRIVTVGGTAAATHATTIEREELGRSSGAPGQRFRLEYAPVLPRRDGETVEVQDGRGGWTRWRECEYFTIVEGEDASASNGAASEPGERARQFVLDGVSGEVSFGPLIREPDGRDRQYGAVPPEGRLIRFTRYRTGGGAAGNVGARTLSVLKSTLPYVDSVVNRAGASGGLDAESLERAKLRAPQMLRTRERAVTAEDFEYLAVAAGQGIRRAKCVMPGDVAARGAAPGTVELLLVPAREPADGPLTAQDLQLGRAARDAIAAYLDERRLLTTVIDLHEPRYIPVTVRAWLAKRPEAGRRAVEEAALAQLYRFLNPLVGGSKGEGWPFGRNLFIAEIYAALQRLPDVEYVRRVTLTVPGQSGALEEVAVPADALIISGAHRVEVE